MAADTLTQATSKEFADYLRTENFTFEGLRGEYDAWWFRKGSVRVVIEDEGYIAIYVFDPSRPKAEILDWQIKLSHAPFGVVARAIDLAQQTVRAAMLPAD